MNPPVKPSDPCYHWKEFRLERIAQQMRNGEVQAPRPQFTDPEKVAIAFLLKRQYQITGVWIEAGRLYYRDGWQGDLYRLSWYDAAILTGYIERPMTKKAIQRKPVVRALLRPLKRKQA